MANGAPNKIIFSYNWNGKLSNRAFTTLRLWNPKKYEVGEVYEIYLNGSAKQDPELLGQAKLMEAKRFHASKINPFISYLDTGYDVTQCRNILRRMYKKDDPELGLYLLVYQKD